MRRILLGGCAIAALTGGVVQAGGLAEPEMPIEVVKERTSSSAGGILIPLLLLILVAAAASSSGGNGGGEQASDRRLKTDMAWVGMTADAIPIWRFRYKGTAPVFEGVMAQDVAMRRPDALVTWPNGVLAVDYGHLGHEMRQVA